MQALLGLERVFDYAIGAGESLINVAAPQMIVERDIGSLAAFKVFQIGERPGRPQHVVHQRVGRHGGDLVINRGQLLIVRRDQLRGLLGHMRIARQDRRDRFADVAHFVERQDRLIVERGTIVRLGNELADVFAGDDAMHAGKRPRRLRVDAANAPVRHRRAKNLAVEHAGQAQVMRIFRAATDLGAHLKARHVPADLIHGRSSVI